MEVAQGTLLREVGQDTWETGTFVAIWLPGGVANADREDTARILSDLGATPIYSDLRGFEPIAISFKSVASACSGCLRLVREIADRSVDKGWKIGVATGDVRQGATAHKSAPCELALDLCRRAAPRSILVSSATASIARLAGLEYGLTEIGTVPVSSGPGVETVFQLIAAGLPSVPVTLTDDGAVIHSIPKSFGFLVGRQAELEDVHAALEDSPVVTLVGLSGIGKSHLANRVARELDESFRDGVFWVDATAAISTDDLYKAIASVLIGGPIGSDLDAEVLVLKALNRSHVLCVLDGCDTCLAAVRELVEVGQPGQSRLLVTARRRTQAPNELVVRVGGLPFPEADLRPETLDLDQYDATALFLDRYWGNADRSSKDSPEPSNVVGICQELYGHPGAIVIAARQAWHVGSDQVLARLKKLGKADPGRRGSERSGAQLAQSYEVTFSFLSSAARSLADTLAVIQGTWTRKEVLALATVDANLVDGALFELVDAGLATNEVVSENVFTFPASLREFLVKNASAEDLKEVSERHCIYYLNLFLSASSEFWGPRATDYLELVDSHFEDVVAALRYMVRVLHDPKLFAETISKGWSYFYQRNKARFLLELIDDATPKLVKISKSNAAAIQNIAGVLAAPLGDARRTRSYYDRALRLAKEANDDYYLAAALTNLGSLEWSESQPREALKRYREAIEVFRRTGHANIRQSIISTVPALLETGDLREAKLALDEAKELKILEGDLMDQWCYVINEGQYELAISHYEAAMATLKRSAILAGQMGDNRLLAASLLLIALCLLHKKDFDLAATFLGSSRALGEATGSLMYLSTALREARVEGKLREVLPESAIGFRRLTGGLMNLDGLLELI